MRFIAAPRVATACRRCALVLALMLSGPAPAAGFRCAPPADAGRKGAQDELQEIVVNGAKVKTGTRDLQAWLKLLVGKYTYEGYVDLCGKGNVADMRPVTGGSDCIASGSGPNVQCTVNVRWPEAKGENGEPVLSGVSSLLPAFVIYALENRYIPEKRVDELRLMFTQVDNKGVAEWASGDLEDDTFTSREPCVGIAGGCQKTTRITATPDSNEVSMQVDVDIDNRRVLRQTFLLHRQSGNGRQSTGSSP